MGRPPHLQWEVPGEERIRVCLRLPAKHKRFLAMLAKIEQRTLSEWIMSRIAREASRKGWR